MTEPRCADPLCGHDRADHNYPDGQGCGGTVCVDEGIPNGPNASPPAYERCWCPKFHETFREDPS